MPFFTALFSFNILQSSLQFLSERCSSFNKELLAQHIRTCVVDDIRAGHDEVVDELVQTLQKVMK